MDRQASLEEDFSIFSGTPDFSDHIGGFVNNVHLVNGDLIDVNCSDATYQRFIRIASAQELEELESLYDASGDGGLYSPGGDSGFSTTFSEPEKITEEELKAELTKTEEEITTLRQVLSAKLRHLQEIKRKLGITVWTEFKDDMQQGIRTIQESEAFQKTSQTLKTAGGKTSEALGSLSASVSKKLGEVRSSSAFKNIEGKVEGAFGAPKGKAAGHDDASLLEQSPDDNAKSLLDKK